MAQTTFYAARSDELDVLRFVFAETDCHVYEAHSRYDQDLRRFTSVEDVCEAFGVGSDRGKETRTVLLDLWSPATGGDVSLRRYALELRDASFRYEVRGWGLFRLELGGAGDGVVEDSWFAHNTRKRAQKWSNAYGELGPPDAWDWDAVTKLGRRIIHHVRNRLAVAKVGSAAVLPQADQLKRSGWILR
jgi:hypothetical protein